MTNNNLQNQSEGGTIKKFIKKIYDPVEYHAPEDQAALEEAHKNALQYASAYNRQVAIDLGVSVPVDDPCFVLPGEPQRELINPIEYYGESPCVPEETPVQSNEIPLRLRSKFIPPYHPEEPAPAPEPVPASVAVPAAAPEPAPAPVAVPSPQPPKPDFTRVESTKLPARLKAARPQKTGAFTMMKKLERNRIIRVCGNSVYFYKGTHYKKMSQQDVKRDLGAFCDWHGDERVYPQKLSPLLYRYAEELYGATKGRSRRDATSNPQYGIWGIHPVY